MSCFWKSPAFGWGFFMLVVSKSIAQMQTESLLSHLSLFSSNTDAIATNRGFYYQFLKLMKTWVTNFINDIDTVLYSELEQDIKEVGDELVFTQIKCYSSSLNLNSLEIKKSIFQFFCLYLKYEGQVPMHFFFSTNTCIRPKEKLLTRWIEDPKLNDNELRVLVKDKIQDLLLKELKLRKNKKLGVPNIQPLQKTKLSNAFNILVEKIKSSDLDTFILSIKWKFNERSPDEDIQHLQQEIKQLLQNEKFNGRPIPLLNATILSEVFSISKRTNSNDRALTLSSLNELLIKTDDQLYSHINPNLLQLLDPSYKLLSQDISKIQTELNEVKTKLNKYTSDHKFHLRDLPHKLTLIPSLPLKKTFERDETSLIIPLLKEKKIIAVCGATGIGKTTTVVQAISPIIDKLDHVVFLEFKTNLIHTLNSNYQLSENLNLKDQHWESEEDRFNQICNHLDKVPGNNLLVIDDFQHDSRLQTLLSIQNWNVVLTTKERINNFPNIVLHGLPSSLAKQLFFSRLQVTNQISDQQLSSLLHKINNNPLLIEVTAQVINLGVELNVEDVIQYLTQDNLAHERLDIHILPTEENIPVHFLNYLYSKFITPDLTKDEKNIFKLIALFHSSQMDLNDLAAIGGQESFQSNLATLNNITNELHRKGWITKDGVLLSIPKILQALIILRSRSEFNPFIECSIWIVWLTHRVRETANKISKQSFAFREFGESVLNLIKEPYRENIYQPLILLENELLHAYTYYIEPKNLLPKLISLKSRTEKRFEETSPILAVVLNNLATCYAHCQNSNDAIKAYKKAIAILKRQNNIDKYSSTLLTAYTNLIGIYIEIEDYSSAISALEKYKAQLKNLGINHHPSIPTLYNILGVAFQRNQAPKAAYSYYLIAIEEHLALEERIQNDFQLILYFSHACLVSHILSIQDKPQEYLDKALILLKQSSNKQNWLVHQICTTLYDLAIKLGKKSEAQDLSLLLEHTKPKIT